MDITLPYKWIREYVETNLDHEEFAKRVSLGGPNIEKWHHDELLDDILLEIEVTPNRPESASILGIASEASAILEAPSTFSPPNITIDPTQTKPFAVEIQDSELCRRYQALVIDGVTVGESPEWMQKRLKALGMNSINILVDISNYVLLEYGQPTHIFDYEKITNNTLIARRAQQGEIFTTLDEQDKELTREDFVLADSEKILGLAGVKGGKSSGVSVETTTVVIESANFEPYAIRKAARRHDLHTDAAALFEKGLHPELTQPALLRVAELVLEHAGGEIVLEIIDEKSYEYEPKVIELNPKLITRMLGVEIPTEEIIEYLERLHFPTEHTSDLIKVTVPPYRADDIFEDYDLVEEVARLYGYDKIPNKLPEGEIPLVLPDPELVWEDKVKDILVGAGATEAYSRDMTGEKVLAYADLSPEDTIQIANPLSIEYAYMRRELASTMVDIAANNEGLEESLTVFELNRVFVPVSSKELPDEHSNLGMLVQRDDVESAYLELKGLWEHILDSVGIDLDRITYDKEPVSRPFARGAAATIQIDNEPIGTIGLIDTDVEKEAKVEKSTAIFDINFTELVPKLEEAYKSYKGIPKYPSVERDFAFLLDRTIPWSEVETAVRALVGDLFESIDLFDVYKGEHMPSDKKSIAFRLVIRSDEKTLTDEDIAELEGKVRNGVSEKFEAELR